MYVCVHAQDARGFAAVPALAPATTRIRMDEKRSASSCPVDRAIDSSPELGRLQYMVKQNQEEVIARVKSKLFGDALSSLSRADYFLRPEDACLITGGTMGIGEPFLAGSAGVD
jgi:hypothetical protein